MNIIFIGDIAKTGIICIQPEISEKRSPHVATLLSQQDFVFANLEAPVMLRTPKMNIMNLSFNSGCGGVGTQTIKAVICVACL